MNSELLGWIRAVKGWIGFAQKVTRVQKVGPLYKKSPQRPVLKRLHEKYSYGNRRKMAIGG